MKKKILLLLLTISTLFVKSQIPNFNWAFNAGPQTFANSIGHDGAGNIYVTGYFFGTIDIDPSSSVKNLSSNGLSDFYVAKFNSAGQHLWSFNVGSIGDDGSYDIEVNAAGDVYVTGYIQGGPADFDPSVGTATLAPVGSSFDGFISKYDSNGNYQWAFSLGSAGRDATAGITSDPSTGDIYVTGYFESTVDMNPSVVVNTITAQGLGWDIFLAKYTSSGNYQWAFPIGANNVDETGLEVCMTSSGNVSLTGYIKGSADFDPSASTAILNCTGMEDLFLAQYDNLGNYQWAFSLGSADSDKGYAVVGDASGNTYVTGYFTGTIDFDPGAGVKNLSSAGATDQDMFIAKYNSTGQYQWAFNLNSATGTDGAYDMAIDANNAIYVTGIISGTADFDPSVGVANLTPVGSRNAIVAKYTTAGAYQYAFNLPVTGGISDTYGSSIDVDGGLNVYIQGTFLGTADFNPGIGTFNLTSIGSTVSTPDLFVAKYSPLCAPFTFTFTTSKAGCPNSNDGDATVYVGGGASPYSYLWDSNASSQTSQTASNLMPGTYSVTVTDNNSCSFTGTVTVTSEVIPTPTICMVTVDSIGKNNVILWDKAQYLAADSFYVYRDIANNNFQIIGRVPATSTYGEFQDTVRSKYPANGDPKASSWKYKIAIKDTCGNLSPLSPYHKSIFTQNSSGNFTWNDYQIEFQPIPVPALNNYVFRRDNNATGNWLNIQTLSASSVAYTDPSYSTYATTADWRIETLWTTFCFSSYLKITAGKIGKSRSNIQNNRFIGINENSLKYGVMVYPNPTNDLLNIEFENTSNVIDIKIVNIVGQLVYQDTANSSTLKKTIDMSSLSKGVYTLVLSNSYGKSQYKLILN